MLRAAGEHFEVIANGVFLMDTRNGESERLLVRAAVDRMPAGGRLLIGGLGVGFSLAEAVSRPAAGPIGAVGPVGEVVVVEREPAVIRWARGPLARVHANALDDPRVRVVEADIVDYLAAAADFGADPDADPGAGPDAGPDHRGDRDDRFDAICLDVDNGPHWTVTAENGRLYDAAGLDLVRGRLRPGGVLAVWSAAADPGFAALLRTRFDDVEVLAVPVARGEPDTVYVACQQYARTV